MEGNARKAFLISALLALLIVSYDSVLSAVQSGATASFGTRTRYKIFTLLDLELQDGSPIGSGPGANTQIYTIDSSNDNGAIKGQARVTQVSGKTAYTVGVRATMKNTPEAGKKYVLWLQSRSASENILIGEQTQSTINVDSFQSTRDLSSYVVIVTQEPVGSSPTAPTSTPDTQAQQQRQVQTQPTPADGDGSRFPTFPPAGPGEPTTLPGQPTTSQPDPTSGSDPTSEPGQPEEELNTKIQTVISAVSETNIRTYLDNLTDAEAAPERDGKQSRYTGATGNNQEAQYIESHLKGLGMDVQMQPFTVSGKSTNNIIGRLYGSDRENWYMVMAHMDSIGRETPGWNSSQPAPGADDNGSGTSAVMEIARAIASSGITLDKSIEFILFSGEEEGLLGSEHYAQNMPAGRNIIGIINLDMVGHKGSKSDCVNFLYKPATGGNLMSDEVAKINTDFSIGLTTQSTSAGYTSRSDHHNFVSRGILGAIGHECEFSTQYHSVQDTTEFISMTQITKAAKAVAGALVRMSHTGLGQGIIPSGGISILGEQSDSTAPLLVKVDYNNTSDLEFLFETANNPLDYFETDDIKQPFFLGLFSNTSLQTITEAGFQARILDDNADMNLYTLLWHPREGKRDLLLSHGEVTELSTNLFLVRYPSVEKKIAAHEGPDGGFFDVPLPTGSEAPPFQTARITAVPTIPQDSTAAQSADSFGKTLILIFGLAMTLMVSIGGFVFLRRKKTL